MSFSEVLKDLSIVVASCTAIYGIGSWRREYVGKKRAELAEEVLCLFYEARDAVQHIRNPFSYGNEGSSRKAAENETPEQKEAYDRAYVLFAAIPGADGPWMKSGRERRVFECSADRLG